MDSSDLGNPPPLPPRLEEQSDLIPLEPNMTSPSSPATTETDISSDSRSPGDAGGPTYDHPVFANTPKSASANILPGGEAEASAQTLAQPADGPVYAQPELTTSSTVTCPPVADNVVYDQVKGFHNSQVC